MLSLILVFCNRDREGFEGGINKYSKKFGRVQEGSANVLLKN